jgi:hypothetical protein
MPLGHISSASMTFKYVPVAFNHFEFFAVRYIDLNMSFMASKSFVSATLAMIDKNGLLHPLKTFCCIGKIFIVSITILLSFFGDFNRFI